MKATSHTQMRSEMRKIIATIRNTPGSRPLALMQAKRSNTSKAWKEKADAKHCDDSVQETVKRFDRASKVLAERN